MITVTNLVFTYPDGTRALDDVEFHVGVGQSAGIIGSNGAGKSTFVNHLNGWFVPQHGRVVVNGIESSPREEEKIRRVVGLVFQNADDQLFTARVWDDVMFGPENLGMAVNDSEEEAERLLRDFGLWEVRNKPPSHLSQGQKRFAALAAVLVMKPAILVMDEPTADLDMRNRRKLIGLVNRLAVTRITVSHDLDLIWETCDTTFIMNRGHMVAKGPTCELLSNRELLEQNGLELPLRLQGRCE